MYDKNYDLKKLLVKDLDFLKSEGFSSDDIRKIRVAQEFFKEIKLDKRIFDDDVDFKPLKRYFAYRANAVNAKKIWKRNSYKYCFDCDKSYPVRKFYKEKNGYDEFYFDSYFSVQPLLGKFIERGHGREKRNDFVWLLENFDDEILKNASEDEVEVLEAFNELAYYYHTIGNLAPCPADINSPKGRTNGCFDRIDLFLKSDSTKENEKYETWVKWFEENSEKYQLQYFLEPELPENPKDDLVKYIHAVVEIIKKRGSVI